MSSHVLLPMHFDFYFIPNFDELSPTQPSSSPIPWPVHPLDTSQLLLVQWLEFPWCCPTPCVLDWRWLERGSEGRHLGENGMLQEVQRQLSEQNGHPRIIPKPLTSEVGQMFSLDQVHYHCIYRKDIYRYVTIKSVVLYIYKIHKHRAGGSIFRLNLSVESSPHSCRKSHATLNRVFSQHRENSHAESRSPQLSLLVQIHPAPRSLFHPLASLNSWRSMFFKNLNTRCRPKYLGCLRVLQH